MQTFSARSHACCSSAVIPARCLLEVYLCMYVCMYIYIYKCIYMYATTNVQSDRGKSHACCARGLDGGKLLFANVCICMYTYIIQTFREWERERVSRSLCPGPWWRQAAFCDCYPRILCALLCCQNLRESWSAREGQRIPVCVRMCVCMYVCFCESWDIHLFVYEERSKTAESIKKYLMHVYVHVYVNRCV